MSLHRVRPIGVVKSWMLQFHLQFPHKVTMVWVNFSDILGRTLWHTSQLIFVLFFLVLF